MRAFIKKILNGIVKKFYLNLKNKSGFFLEYTNTVSDIKSMNNNQDYFLNKINPNNL